MNQPVILIGGGEHARVVAEAVRSRPDVFELRGFVDPAPCVDTVQRLGLARLGDEAVLAQHGDAFGVISLAALDSVELRKQIAARLRAVLRGFATVVHARAWVSPTATLAEGVVVMAGAVIQSGARLLPHSIVNSSAVVEHDVELGAFAHLAPRAALGGGSRVGEGSFVGMGACVRDHVAVGSACVVAMGSVVVHDLPDRARVKGVPAR